MSMKLGSDPNSFDGELMTEMNTTPLIDVMLVLLVMLIITIPIQLHSVNLDMPKAVTQPPKEKPQIVKIEVNASNQTLWNGEILADKNALQAKLDMAFKASPEAENQPEIHVKPSSSAKYENVAAVMAAAQRSGLKKIGIVSEQ